MRRLTPSERQLLEHAVRSVFHFRGRGFIPPLVMRRSDTNPVYALQRIVTKLWLDRDEINPWKIRILMDERDEHDKRELSLIMREHRIICHGVDGLSFTDLVILIFLSSLGWKFLLPEPMIWDLPTDIKQPIGDVHIFKGSLGITRHGEDMPTEMLGK